METIEGFRGRLDGETLAMVDRLRAIVSASHPGLTERVKWNAPSFAIGDDDRITLGVERKGGVRLVLHRGAKVRDGGEFSFHDPESLAKWPTADRGVIVWKDVAAITRVECELTLLCRRWIDEVDEPPPTPPASPPPPDPLGFPQT